MNFDNKWVLVSTDKRGVFFGQLESFDEEKLHIVLKRPQQCIYWDVATKGFLGLASGGPTRGCRITGCGKRARIEGVTSITEVTAIAKAAWKAAPWADA